MDELILHQRDQPTHPPPELPSSRFPSHLEQQEKLMGFPYEALFLGWQSVVHCALSSLPGNLLAKEKKKKVKSEDSVGRYRGGGGEGGGGDFSGLGLGASSLFPKAAHQPH